MVQRVRDASRSPEPTTQFDPAGAGSMWRVDRILDERGPPRDGEYLVQWDGTNPDTGISWEPTWEPRNNCNDLLITEWKQKKRQDPLIVGKEGKKLEEIEKDRKRRERKASEKKRKRASEVAEEGRKRGKGTPSRTPLSPVSRSPSIVSSTRSPSVKVGSGLATRTTRRSTAGAAESSPSKAGPSKLSKQIEPIEIEDDDEPGDAAAEAGADQEVVRASSRAPASRSKPRRVSVEVVMPQKRSASKKRVRMTEPGSDDEEQQDAIDLAAQDSPEEPAAMHTDITVQVAETEDEAINIAPPPAARPPVSKVADRRKRINLSSSATVPTSRQPATVRDTGKRPTAARQSSPITSQTQNDTIEEFSSPEGSSIKGKSKAAPPATASAEEDDSFGATDEDQPALVMRMEDGEEVWVNEEAYGAETLATQAPGPRDVLVEETVVEAVVTDRPVEEESAQTEEDLTAPQPTQVASGQTISQQDYDRLMQQTRKLFEDLQAERNKTEALQKEVTELQQRPVPEPVIVERVVERVVERLKTPPPAPAPVLPVAIAGPVDESAELQRLRDQVLALQRSSKKLENDTDFVRSLYTEASNSAVQHANNARELENQVKTLKSQLSVGLKQRHDHFEALAAAKAAESDKLRRQNKVLLDQARLTDDKVRFRAARYPQVLQESGRLRELLSEQSDAVARLKSRNEALVDQVEVLRAMQMGVLPRPDGEGDDESEASDTESDASYQPPSETRGRSDPTSSRAGFVTASPGHGTPSATRRAATLHTGLSSRRSTASPAGRTGLPTSDVRGLGSNAKQSLKEGGEHYECQWREDDNQICRVSTDTTEAMLEHVELVHYASMAALQVIDV